MTFIFNRCRRREAASIPVNYKIISDYWSKKKKRPVGELTNEMLVNPIDVAVAGTSYVNRD